MERQRSSVYYACNTGTEREPFSDRYCMVLVFMGTKFSDLFPIH